MIVAVNHYLAQLTPVQTYFIVSYIYRIVSILWLVSCCTTLYSFVGGSLLNLHILIVIVQISYFWLMLLQFSLVLCIFVMAALSLKSILF